MFDLVAMYLIRSCVQTTNLQRRLVLAAELASAAEKIASLNANWYYPPIE
jgi:hypothetical protein